MPYKNQPRTLQSGNELFTRGGLFFADIPDGGHSVTSTEVNKRSGRTAIKGEPPKVGRGEEDQWRLYRSGAPNESSSMTTKPRNERETGLRVNHYLKEFTITKCAD